MKISWNSTDRIYSKESLLALTAVFRRLQNLLQVIPTVSLLKLVNIIMLAFSLSLVLDGDFLFSLSTVPHNKGDSYPGNYAARC